MNRFAAFFSIDFFVGAQDAHVAVSNTKYTEKKTIVAPHGILTKVEQSILATCMYTHYSTTGIKYAKTMVIKCMVSLIIRTTQDILGVWCCLSAISDK